MSTIKTKVSSSNVEEFINSFADTEQKRKDSFELMQIMQDFTGYEPRMWGPSIIGFGSYHYKYESGHEGDSLLVGFSPRKAAISLYVYMGTAENEKLLEELGKFKMGKGCIYVKKLSDINVDTLKKMMGETIRFLKEKYPERN